MLAIMVVLGDHNTLPYTLLYKNATVFLYSSVVGLIIQLQLCTVQKQGRFIPNQNIYYCRPL